MAEILAIGAVKVAGVAGAGVAIGKLGSNLEEFARSSLPNASAAQDLREQLRSAHLVVDTRHREATAIWRIPLSLFDERCVDPATPKWAVGSVLKAQALVYEAAELGDLADVYEAQILIAELENRSFSQAPVYSLIDQLDDLGLRLQVHLPCLVAARRAVDLLTEAARDADQLPSIEPSEQNEESTDARRVDLPTSILDKRSRLVQSVRCSMNSIGHSVTCMNNAAAQHMDNSIDTIGHTMSSLNHAAWESAQQVAQMTNRAETKGAGSEAPVELSSYALQYL